MADQADLRSLAGAPPAGVASRADRARRRFVVDRLHRLEELEGRLLDLAVQASDDSAARWLEGWADTAWRDAEALREEHGSELSDGLP